MQTLKYIILAFQLVSLIAAVIVFVRVFRYIKSLPEDEVLGEDRAKVLNTHMRILFICIGTTCALSLAQTILRLL